VKMVSCTLIIKLLSVVVPAKCLKDGVDVEPVRLPWSCQSSSAGQSQAGGVARGPRLTNPGQVVGKQHLSPTPRPPLAMPMDEMTNENQYRMNTIILFYRQHALHAMQAPIF